ncbi:MAG: 4Fe-4S binding protein [Nitrospiraceae bacterium]|nr:4Fe-4S binding protein [Nitrospiraceae bacterium]
MFEVKELKTADIMADSARYGCCVKQARYYFETFLKELMCGRCHPCALGSHEAMMRLERLTVGRGAALDMAALRRIAENMLFGSMCKKGKDSAEFLRTWLDSGEFAEHAAGICRHAECSAMVSYSIDASRCSHCGLCREACCNGAITGEKRKPYLIGYPAFEIRDKKCTRCGKCEDVCTEGAVQKIMQGSVLAGRAVRVQIR